MSRAKPQSAPLYQMVKDHVIDKILGGHWTEGMRVPSEHDLTQALGVSRMTAHRALRELTKDGWLTRVRGGGTYVAPLKPQSALLEIRNIRDEIEARGHHHSCDVIVLGIAKADGVIATALEIDESAEVFHSILLHKENNLPVQLEERHVSPAFAPDYLAQAFDKITAYEYLHKIGPPDASEHVIEAILPDPQMRLWLKIEAQEPCLQVVRRTWTNGAVALLARLTYPGSRYRLAGRKDHQDNANTTPLGGLS